MKSFVIALDTGGKNLGELSIKLNRLVGYGPVLLGGGQVVALDDQGQYITGGGKDMGNYMVHMLKLQSF